MKILSALDQSGADIVEVGMPFSDPIADGPTIQASNSRALENGMSLSELFKQLEGMRGEIDLPVILMGYINPVLQYGVERFCSDCRNVGVDGVILPDLPMQEYLDEYKLLFDAYGLFNIFLVTPQTSEKRIREIDRHTEGFIYMVSTSGTTGARQDITEAQISYFKRIRSMQLQNPVLIGFGISNRQTFENACDHANGAIIGSAFIKLLAETGNLEKGIKKFIQEIKGIQL
jgi:tryptophan synthase alpha chain